MLNQEGYVKVLVLHRQGWSNKVIAAELGFHPATIANHLKAGGPPSPRLVTDEERVMSLRRRRRVEHDGVPDPPGSGQPTARDGTGTNTSRASARQDAHLRGDASHTEARTSAARARAPPIRAHGDRPSRRSPGTHRPTIVHRARTSPVPNPRSRRVMAYWSRRRDLNP